MMNRFVKESRIGAPPQTVFAFHEKPGALEQLTPPWENVRLVASTGSLQPGSRVVLKSKLGPFTLRWVAEHTEYEQGRFFADRQIRGPFAFWHHRHLFLHNGKGGTILRDEVEYEPPLGKLGRFLGGRFIESKLKRLFDYRHDVTRRVLESGSCTSRSEGSP
jgi:ligand-binding SRPBCC domain-containing protein